jgi:hypothetical protein
LRDATGSGKRDPRPLHPLGRTLDDTLLEAFMTGFYGYGTWAAKYWFVGLEEGGGQTCDEIARRIETWKKRKRPEIDDIREFHHEACLTVRRNTQETS